MLLVDIHQLNIVLAKSVGVRTLEDKVDNIGGVFSFEGEDVIVLRSAEDLGEGGEVDAERNVSIASEWSEHLSLQHHGY